MLGVSIKIPRKVSIKVARAENLRQIMKDGKKKVNNKYKIVVLGGKKKESSNTELGTNGNVQWSFNCVIKLHRNQVDPIALLVEDSDGHHIGQVLIPIVKISAKPYIFSTDQGGATSNNILCSELEPTNKCSNPSGFLFYWIWVEEYYEDGQGDSGKKSINKSMSSLFGSKSKLGLSKSNLEINPSDSISNYGSVSNLNKPEKQKKTPNLLKLRIGKKKPKPNLSNAKVTPESSDVETSSNFSFNQGIASKNSSYSGLEMINPIIKGYLNDQHEALRNDLFGHSENQNHSKSAIGLDHNFNKTTSVVPLHNSQNPISNNPSAYKIPNNTESTNKLNTLNLQTVSQVKEPSVVVKISSNDSDERDIPSQHHFNIPKAGSDYSMLNNKSDHTSPIFLNKSNTDELENIINENIELRAQNNQLGHKIDHLQMELDSVKMVLCKLRSKLLEDGETKYLEIRK